MPSEESGASKPWQDSEESATGTGSIVSQAATSLSRRQSTSPSANANVSERAGLGQSHALFDSRNVLISGGQFHNTLGHHTSFVVHINHSTSEGSPADSQSESNSPPLSLNETQIISPAQFSDQSSQDNHERNQSQVSSQSQEISSQKPNDIYERHLTLKERGFPLWIPDPDQNLHLDYRRTGVRIGDVGIITDSGAFSFLFNICLPHNHPVNPRMLPEHFAPISPPIEASDIGKFGVFKNGSHLASASVKISQRGSAISDIVFESSASEGAILTMPRGARSEDLRNKATFREYTATNVANWYRYANGPRGLEAKNGEVRLVVGFDKTTSWGIATFANQTQQNGCRLKFGRSEEDSASTTYTWSQLEYSGVADVKAGPDSDEIDVLRIDSDPSDVQFENQCLFVRTLNATLADDVWADIHSTSGSISVDPRNSQYPRVKNYSNSNRSHWSNPDNGSNFSPSQGAQSGIQRRLQGGDITPDENPPIFVSGPVESIASTAHPSKVLNNALLAKIPTAKMVITDDGDWSSQYNTVLDPHELVANILASRDICEENGVVFLQPMKTINEIPNPTSMDHAQGRDLLPEAAVVQLEDPTAHYVSPHIYSDREEEYVNEYTASFKCTDLTISHTIPPSRVRETPAICPRYKFHILLVGQTGVGKSSLISFFNIGLHNSDGVNGKADISHEYFSPIFIFHDSMGFEPGYIDKLEIFMSSLRAEDGTKLQNQVHAIWLCIETHRTGSRLLQTEDEDFLRLAKQLKIPVIVVFTKYDLLIVEHYRACSHIPSQPDRKAEARERAARAFSERTKELKVPFVPVTTLREAMKEYGGAMIMELTKVTRDNLRDVEGSLWALWATAQEINARQKVELSISEGLKKYWRDLGGIVFQEYRLIDCIARIHVDVLKIWNFHDPSKVLSGEEFFKGMIGLVEPLSDEGIRNQRGHIAANLVAVADAVEGGLVFPVLGAIIAMPVTAFQVLCSKYQKGVSSATYLATYIVDLILVFYEISTVMTVHPPKSLSTDLVMDALATYKSRSPHVHGQVKEIAFTLEPEEKIASVIRDALPPRAAGSTIAYNKTSP